VGSEVYTTMEPCSERLSKKTSCTQHLLHHKVKRVIIGVLEPDNFVKCDGVKLLEEAGIQVDFTTDLTALCTALNSHLTAPL